MTYAQLELLPTSRTCSVCSGWGELEATDIFCGAGGSSLGLEGVGCPSCGRPLIRVTQALNHWDLAVEAHNANFPHADHDVHDVEVIPATRFRRTPLLWASPECTHHAYCRGPRAYDPDATRSRATFGDIVRFTEHHRYDAVIIENVIEARLWCEASTRRHGWDETKQAYRCSCGVDFDAWFKAMTELGYRGRVVYFNSQFALPTPQSRDRMYVVFWREGLPEPPLDFHPSSWCSRCETIVRGVQSWKKPSKGSARTQDGMFEWGRYGIQYIYRCPDCAEPVAPAVTGARSIIDWDLPATAIGDRAVPLAPKTIQRIRAGLERLQTLDPITVQVGGNLYERRPGVRVWSVNDPLRTVVGTSQLALVVRYGGQGAAARADAEPMQTITAHDREIGLVCPAGGQEAHARSLAEPSQTIVGSDRLALIVQNMENNLGRTVDEPTPPVTGGGNHLLVQVNRSTRGKAVDRNADPLEVPTRTIAGHGELALVSLRNHGDVRPADEPAPTLAAGGTHHGLLVYNGNPGHIRELDEPAGVVKGRDSQSLLVPYNRTGRATADGEPMGTLTTRDREALVVTDADIDACLFRMLQWPELLRAQQMHEHADGRPYDLTARRRDHRGKMRDLSNEQRVKMIGNAVSSPVATMLGYAVVSSLL